MLTDAFETWGVDPHVRHTAFGFASATGGLAVAELRIADEDTPTARLVALHAALTRYAQTLVAERGKPAAVAVELPIGAVPKPILTMAAGVTLLALAQALRDVPVWTLTPGEWKKRAIGRGNATKADVAGWANDQRVACETQDQADALGIAVAAHRLLLPDHGARRVAGDLVAVAA